MRVPRLKGRRGTDRARKINESQENIKDVQLLMKSLHNEVQVSKLVYSDSDDEMCTIKDQFEEKASSALNTLRQAEIFVRSPSKGEESKESQLKRATQLIEFSKLEASQRSKIQTNAF